jgi:hypothetical protein
MQKIYRRWRWDIDCGEEEISHLPGEYETFAIVYHDDRLLPYRVVCVNGAEGAREITLTEPFKYCYDYLYADDGRLMEKRSLDEMGEVDLIVRYQRLSDGSTKETAWCAE